MLRHLLPQYALCQPPIRSTLPMRTTAGLLPLAVAASLGATCLGHRSGADAQPAACTGDNGGITLSPGYCATAFADHLGHVRHLVVAPDGVVYANAWSGRYYHDDTPPPGGFLIALQSSHDDGRTDRVVRFGPTHAEGNAGGTGIAIYHGYLYAETNDRIVRYKLPTSGIAPAASRSVHPNLA